MSGLSARHLKWLLGPIPAWAPCTRSGDPGAGSPPNSNTAGPGGSRDPVQRRGLVFACRRGHVVPQMNAPRVLSHRDRGEKTLTSRTLGLWALVVVGALGGNLVACSDDASSELGMFSLSTLMQSRDTNIILVYPATTCFSCTNSLAAWSKVGHRKGHRIWLVIAGKATQAEVRALRRYRLPMSIRRADPEDHHLKLPPGSIKELVVIDGTVRDSALQSEQSRASPLLIRIAEPGPAASH